MGAIEEFSGAHSRILRVPGFGESGVECQVLGLRCRVQMLRFEREV